MTVQTITLGLPEAIHKQLESQARAKARPIEEVAIQALAVACHRWSRMTCRPRCVPS